MPRYFYSELASRPIQGGVTVINFEKTCIIGSNICGIYATDDPNEIALLMGAISQRAGVVEISQADYAAHQAQKKTIQFSPPSLTLKAVPQVAPPTTSRLAEKSGVESAGNTEAQKSSEIKSGKVEDPKSVIKIDSVASPGFVQEQERTAPVETKPKKANVKANARAA